MPKLDIAANEIMGKDTVSDCVATLVDSCASRK